MLLKLINAKVINIAKLNVFSLSSLVTHCIKMFNLSIISIMKEISLNFITRDAEPELDPPVLLVGSYGFLTGPEAEVKLLAEQHKSSHTALPRIRPPDIKEKSSNTVFITRLFSSHIT